MLAADKSNPLPPPREVRLADTRLMAAKRYDHILDLILP